MIFRRYHLVPRASLNSAVPNYTISLIAQIAECNEGGRRKELIRAWPRNLPEGHQSVSKLLIRRHPTGLFFAAARTDAENRIRNAIRNNS